jgi:hypothetical protein
LRVEEVVTSNSDKLPSRSRKVAAIWDSVIMPDVSATQKTEDSAGKRAPTPAAVVSWSSSFFE